MTITSPSDRFLAGRPSIGEPDYGTPASDSDVMLTVTIDGVETTVPQGTSIMRAAGEQGCSIPKLCATDSLEPFGSCRMCLVEVDGRRGTPASCTTPVEDGMIVRTQTEKLAKLRRNTMELYISDHPLDCLTCPANGDCELQDMAGVVGLREQRYGYDGENHLKEGKDESSASVVIVVFAPVMKFRERLRSRLKVADSIPRSALED
jgi:formate dehydrogenase major subunit